MKKGIKTWPRADPEKAKTLVRIGSDLRKFAADREVTHEQLGRIVRCIVLETDVFVSKDIAPMVAVLAKDAVKREKCRKHMIELRIRQGKKSGISYPCRNAGPGPCRNYKKKHKLLGDVKDETSRKMLIDLINTGVMGAQRGNRSAFRYEGTEEDDKPKRPSALTWLPAYFERFWRAYPRKDRPGNARNSFAQCLAMFPDVDETMDVLMKDVEEVQRMKDPPSACSFLANWKRERGG